jgi:SNF2 family DNA or RNA helicase
MAFIGTPYPYQQEAIDRMVDQGKMLLGVCMGGGKTLMTIAAIERLYDEGEIRRALVVVPASLKYQWLSEIKKFTDSRAVVIDGSAEQRKALWRASTSVKYVIINPESLINDLPQLVSHKFDLIAVDEATMLKTRSSKRSRMLKKIGNSIFYRFALTGQPIENRPEELFSIMEFVDKEVLGDFRKFDNTFIVRNNFGRPVRYRNLDRLTDALVDRLIRKTRADIADQLPQVIHQTIAVPFDDAGGRLYRHIANDLISQIQDATAKHGKGFSLWSHYNGEGDEAQGQIMSRLTVLRMLCDNPQLVKDSANEFADSSTKAGSQYAADIAAAGLLSNVDKTPKLNAVLEYIEQVLSEDPANKVVLFSFFKNNLRLLQRNTSHLTNSVLFMGGMTNVEREAAKEKFRNDPGTRLFLSSDAGGYGVDLPMANVLISYDLPWSSGKLEQREARIIRLSSEFPHVTIATFVMRGSIEERQYEMLQHKRMVNEAFVDGKHHEQGVLEVDVSTLTNFLKSTEL